jgi:hypothetical protein
VILNPEDPLRKCLLALLNTDSNFVYSRNDSASVYTLKEHEPNAKLKEVKLTYLPKNSIVIKLDGAPGFDTLFTSREYPALQRCDYIILTAYATQNYVIYIELKSDKPRCKKISDQFKGATCFLDYLQSFVVRLAKYSTGFSGFEQRFVCFSTGHINLVANADSLGRNLKSKRHDSPENFQSVKTYSGQQHHFGKLIR